MKSLKDYIADNHDNNQSAFARANNVQRAQVSQWIKAGYIVIDDKLCAVRRLLKKEAITEIPGLDGTRDALDKLGI